jgi:hypothetical protein
VLFLAPELVLYSAPVFLNSKMVGVGNKMMRLCAVVVVAVCIQASFVVS